MSFIQPIKNNFYTLTHNHPKATKAIVCALVVFAVLSAIIILSAGITWCGTAPQSPQFLKSIIQFIFLPLGRHA